MVNDIFENFDIDNIREAKEESSQSFKDTQSIAVRQGVDHFFIAVQLLALSYL